MQANTVHKICCTQYVCSKLTVQNEQNLIKLYKWNTKVCETKLIRRQTHKHNVTHDT